MITYNYGNSHSPITLLQMVGDHDLPGIENEIREIHRLTNQEFAFVGVKVENWNHDLSPWKAPAVFEQRFWRRCGKYTGRGIAIVYGQ